MQSELNGRLRNTHLPYHKGLMPVYEAVINSIESIEDRSEVERKPLANYSISLMVDRTKQLDLITKPGPRPGGEINGFRIVDNGIGFNDDNWKSFRTLDSLHKIDKGCRGIGRLMWLKAFDNVTVDSTYCENGRTRTRRFIFDTQNEASEQSLNSPETATISTVVHLNGFKTRFSSATHKTLEKLASGLLEHCLWYFIRTEGVPRITICDDSDQIDLSELFGEYMHSSSSRELVEIKEHQFAITHVRIRVSRNKIHTLGYCAAGRLVKEENITGKVPGLFSAITDSNGQFTYMAYLTGEYLDDQVAIERVYFNIPETTESLFEETEVSFDDIRKAVFPRVAEYLRESLEQVLSDSKKKIVEFVSTKAPKFRPLLSHIPTERLTVPPNTSDKDLEILLHRESFEVEQDVLQEGHELLAEIAGFEDYSDRLKCYMEKVTDLKQSDLASYVAHRRVVIDLLDYATKSQEDGTFVREDIIHDLIVPMRMTSTDAKYRRQNLWLVDERLAFHHYLASDLPLKSNPTTSDTSTKEPDIAALRVFGNPLLVGDGATQHASITVVEIKRPMRDGFRAGESEDEDPILQSLRYLRRLREGSCTVDGRPIPNAARIPGFVYVLADFTNSLRNCCKMHQLQITSDGLGYFGYHRDESYNAYIQVISFDGVFESAKERNKAFFDELGLPSR